MGSWNVVLIFCAFMFSAFEYTKSGFHSNRPSVCVGELCLFNCFVWNNDGTSRVFSYGSDPMIGVSIFSYSSPPKICTSITTSKQFFYFLYFLAEIFLFVTHRKRILYWRGSAALSLDLHFNICIFARVSATSVALAGPKLTEYCIAQFDCSFRLFSIVQN